MLMPSIFGESFLNDFIEPFETSNNSSTFMNTDVEENEKGYMITMDIPAYIRRCSRRVERWLFDSRSYFS